MAHEPGRDSLENASSEAPRYVASLSWPRSGYALTQSVLSEYFQGRFTACEFYTPSREACCKAFPCRNPRVSLSKNHDFGIVHRDQVAVPKLPGVPYLVLVRNFLESLVSGFEKRRKLHPDLPDTPRVWRAFAKQKRLHYRGFVRKWVLDPAPIERLVIRYEDLTSEPERTFETILRFCQPGLAVDQARLRQVVQGAARFVPETARGVVPIPSAGIQDRRQIEEFSYFDARSFAALESKVAAELRALGYPMRYASTRRARFALPGLSWFRRDR